MNPSVTECKLITRIVPRSKTQPSHDDLHSLKASATKTIKKFSHYKHKSEIAQYVEENIASSPGYANGKPMNYHSVVHKGILKFAQQREEKDKARKFDDPSSFSTLSE